MSYYEGISPVEVDVSTPDNGEENFIFESAIASHVNQAWQRAKFAKQETVERFLQCERQRRGVYDPDKAAEIAQTGGSDIFMMITDIKCRAAESWIRDVMLNQQDRPFDLEPSEEPNIPPEVRLDIINMVRTEAEAFLQTGQQLHPETFRRRLEDVHDEVMLQIREEAKRSAGRMGDVIEDQLHRGKFDKAIKEFINDFVTYPVAIIKGPTVRKRKRLTWGPDFLPIVINDFNREVERVSPFDIYPSPNSQGPDDGYLIQRHRLNREKLSAFKGVPGYSDDGIEQALLRFGRKGYRTWVQGDQERDNLEGKLHSRIYNEGVIEAIEYWGPASGQMLKEWGMKGKIDEFKEYEINCWMVGPYIIKLVLNPDPLGKRPYDIASWEEIPGAFYGLALPEIMRDVQIMCNASARALANNLGIASGPQVEVTVDRMAEGEDLTQMYPWKIWQTTSDRTGGGQPGIRFFQPEMNSGVLMEIYTQFSKQADEVTGIPNYVYGSTAVSGAGRTASGLSMLMDNASKGIKQAIAMIDKVIAAVVQRFYVHNMMFNPDPYIKGDFKVVTKGILGLLHKEQVQARRTEFLQSTANPVDLQILGPNGRAYLLRSVAETLDMDTDSLVPDQDHMQFQQDQQKIAQMQQLLSQGQASGQPPVGQTPPQPRALGLAGQPAGGPAAQAPNNVSVEGQ